MELRSAQYLSAQVKLDILKVEIQVCYQLLQARFPWHGGLLRGEANRSSRSASRLTVQNPFAGASLNQDLWKSLGWRKSQLEKNACSRRTSRALKAGGCQRQACCCSYETLRGFEVQASHSGVSMPILSLWQVRQPNFLQHAQSTMSRHLPSIKCCIVRHLPKGVPRIN